MGCELGQAVPRKKFESFCSCSLYTHPKRELGGMKRAGGECIKKKLGGMEIHMVRGPVFLE